MYLPPPPPIGGPPRLSRLPIPYPGGGPLLFMLLPGPGPIPPIPIPGPGPMLLFCGGCLEGSNLPAMKTFLSFPPSLVPPNPPPNFLGNQLGTVCPLSTSTTTDRPSNLIPSAARYARFISSSCSYSTNANPRLFPVVLSLINFKSLTGPCDSISRSSLRSVTS